MTPMCRTAHNLIHSPAATSATPAASNNQALEECWPGMSSIATASGTGMEVRRWNSQPPIRTTDGPAELLAVKDSEGTDENRTVL